MSNQALPTTQEILGPGGILTEHRKPQIDMAHVVHRAMQLKEPATFEAGTGTGKTFAYAVPAILYGKECQRPIIISTATKALQGQIFNKDLPFLLETLRTRYGMHFSFRLAKGRANYVSIRRFRDLRQKETGKFDGMGNPDIVEEIERMAKWLSNSESGDFDELDWEPSDWLRAKVAATSENCQGRRCPNFDGCFYQIARERVQAADIVICNHAVLAADLALGGGFLLPDAGAVIIDEAHQFPDVLEETFTTQFKLSVFTRLRNDLKDQYEKALDTPAWAAVRQYGSELIRCIQEYPDDVDTFSIQPPTAIAEPLARALNDLLSVIPCDDDLMRIRERIDNLGRAVLGLKSNDGFVLWVQREKDAGGNWVNAVLKQTPLDISSEMFPLYERGAVICTSATLSVGGDFRAFKQKLGVPSRAHFDQVYGSPFNFKDQCLYYFPKGGPDPAPANEEAYIAYVTAQIREILPISQGRAFCLFTSNRAMHKVADNLIGSIPYPAMRQGDAPKDALIAWFKRTPGAVLFATASFWEGVSIEGDQLSAVIIDKIPFQAPGDPVAQFRKWILECQGKNYFAEVALPEAITRIKQGVGRLIRTQTDRGLVAVLDSRLHSKGYGRQILRALPPATVIADLGCFHVSRIFGVKGGEAKSA